MMKTLHKRLLIFGVIATLQSIAYGAAALKEAQEITTMVTRLKLANDNLGPISYIGYTKGTMQCSRWPMKNKTICNSTLFAPFGFYKDLGYPADFMIGDLPEEEFDVMARDYEKQEKDKKDKKDQLEKKKAADDTSTIVLPRIWKQKNLAFNQAWEQAQTNADKVYLLEEAIKIANTPKALLGLEHYIDSTSILPYLKIDLRAKIQAAKQRIQ